MKLIVGLGNPGPEYTKTRHNAGFMVIERLAARNGLGAGAPVKVRFHANTLDVTIAGEKCLLLQPMTFMNRSGLSVGEAVNFFKLDPRNDLLVVVDDLALPCGRIRLRKEGSAGGHNGLADIERALGSNVYPRLRIGIDPKGQMNQSDYVLGRFSPEQSSRFTPSLDDAVDAIECWLKSGIDKAMSLYNAGSEK